MANGLVQILHFDNFCNILVKLSGRQVSFQMCAIFGLDNQELNSAYKAFIFAVFMLCLLIYRLPKYATKFIEMCLMVTADHGPAVSGAHNTIVCARAGKDLVSCLASGLLTIVSDVYQMLWLK